MYSLMCGIKRNKVSDHSTSDDSSVYRPVEEIKYWSDNDYPTHKLRYLLISKGLWDEEKDKSWLEEAKNDVMKAFKNGEEKHKSNWEVMFDDVYKYMPQNLIKQKNMMAEHLKTHKQHYPLDEYDAK